MRYRVIALTLPLAFSLVGSSAVQLVAQDPQDTSVAEAARRAQEQKKAATKPVKVITNETLPAAPRQDSSPAPGTPSMPSSDATAQTATSTEAAPAATSAETGTAPAADAAAASSATTDAKATAGQSAAADPSEEAKTNPEVASLKHQIADQQKKVELLMRLYALDQDAFLSNPDHAKDLEGKTKLDAQQEEIHAMVAELAHLKEKLEAIAPGESAKVVAPKP